ncbi:nucleoplasmin [Holotrichia oblita]|uniref:Nucleoplasmin n=2 Tax=Holotrichia oblita TaxID=644536 RepID=A0ACB9T5H0_HOLOL|nr:nucleoplasmin [Holotrichia oblita]KAI4462010.1 nucleoplasmin [Holotrichia oblita]
MADEHFFALTLQGAKASEVWDPEAKGADDSQGGHKLIIKQALLGPEAVDAELNVVQVQTMAWNESVKVPVATLKAGQNSQGTGPVHIIGHHLIGGPFEEFEHVDDFDEVDEEEMLDDEEGEEGEEEDEEDEAPKSKKAKTTNNAKGKGAATKNNKGKK